MDYERAKQIAEVVFSALDMRPTESVVGRVATAIMVSDKEKPAAVKPIPGWIFVEEIKPQEAVSDGGLFIPPNNTDQDLARARVLAVNDVIMKGGKVRPCLVKPGQIVMYEKFRGNDLQIGEHHYVIVEEKHLLAVEDERGSEESAGQAGGCEEGQTQSEEGQG